MNYRERIERLREKGIFSDDQVRRLEASFSEGEIPSPAEPKRGMLEIGGLLLVAALMVGFGYGAAATMSGPQIPQEVAATLDAASGSGIAAGSALWVVLGMIALGLYLLFYMIVRYGYRRLWSLWLDRERVLADHRGLLAMEEALTERLETMRQKPSEGMKSPDGLYLDAGDEARSFVMQTVKDLSYESQDLQQRSEELKMRYQRFKKSLPGSLATLAGTLPEEEE
ncbi:hypothetical protein [Nitratifractor sp.]